MTSRADAAPPWADGPPRPPSGAAVLAPLRAGAPPTAVQRALRALRHVFRARAPGAHGLTDRQLADIGLLRADLPDARGWRR